MNRPCQVEAGNRFLLAVSRAAKRLNDQLEVIPLSRGTVLTHPVLVRIISISGSGPVSLLKMTEDGRTVEVGRIGTCECYWTLQKGCDRVYAVPVGSLTLSMDA